MSSSDRALHVSLGPTASLVAGLVAAVRDDQLHLATPCTEWDVAALLGHVDGLCVAFTGAARKQPVPGAPGGVPALEPGWRRRIPDRLEELARAWAQPHAWTGTTEAGGVPLTGEQAGMTALDEVLVHGWDLAAATGQSYDPPDDAVHAAHAFIDAAFGDRSRGPFPPAVAPPDDATRLERVVALTGRRPRR